MAQALPSSSSSSSSSGIARRKLQSLKSMFRKSKFLKAPDGDSDADADRTSLSLPPVADTEAMANALSKKHGDYLRRILTDDDKYAAVLNSLEEVRELDNIRSDLKGNNAEVARKNLDFEAEIDQLQNQCNVIRTTQLAAAQENFASAQSKAQQVVGGSSPAQLINQLQEAAKSVDDESEELHKKFMAGEVDMRQFYQTYRSQRVLYHKRTLLQLAAADCGLDGVTQST